MEYRGDPTADIWHFCRSCSKWPRKRVSSLLWLDTPLTYLKLCPECVTLTATEVPLLTTSDAAKLLHVPTEKILDMIEDKKLRAFKVGRLWRLRASDLSKHLQEKSG
jgi:excisionase family DNA binding protein